MSEQNEESGNFVNPDFAKFDGLPVTDLVKAFKSVGDEKEAAELALKKINAQYDFLRLVKIPAIFDEQELKNITVDGVGRCQLTSDIYASVKTGQKDAMFLFLRDTGRESLIKEEVNASTLKACLKGMIKAGEEIPEELFNCAPYSRASITKV